jgi:hypothetical protein
MASINDRQPTSPYGVIRNAHRAQDAATVRLIDGAAQQAGAAVVGGNTPPATPVEAVPDRGSSVHVIA